MPFPTLSAITGEDVQEIKDSLEKQRKELQWLLSSLDELNIKSLSADLIKVGPNTKFEPGYDPVAVAEFAKIQAEQLVRDQSAADGIITDGKINDAKEWFGQVVIDESLLIRNDLNLTAPLPTSIMMDSSGITAFSYGSSYARMDYRGLYIQGGAIDIRTNYEPNRGVYFDANGIRAYDNMGRKTFDITSNGEITLGGPAGTFINRDGLIADFIIGNTFVVGRNSTNTKLTMTTSDTGSHKFISNQAAGFEIGSSGSLSLNVGVGYPIWMNGFTRVYRNNFSVDYYDSALLQDRPLLATNINEKTVAINGTLNVTSINVANGGLVAKFG
jgi:hypothetical protein